MTNEPERCSKSEYARLRGVSTSYVSKLNRQQRLVVDQDGLVVVKRSDQLVNATKDPARGGDRTGKSSAAVHMAATVTPPPAGAGSQDVPAFGAMSLASASRDEKLERIRLLRIDVAERCGALVKRDLVDAEAFKRGRHVQEALMSLKDRLAPLLAVESDQAAVEALLDAEFRHVLASIAVVAAPAREVAA